MSRRFTTSFDGPIGRIVFDDGGMNLISAATIDELAGELDRVPPVVRTAEFRSGRAGIFAAGADMGEMRRFGAREAERFSRLGQGLMRRIESAHYVSVATIDGDCFGGALDLALAFDLRVATRRARFSHPGSRIGIVTGFGGTSRWRGVVSRRHAAYLFLANAIIDADAALGMELVDSVVDHVDEVDAILDRLARTTVETIRFAREISLRPWGLGATGRLLVSRRLAQFWAEGHDGTD